MARGVALEPSMLPYLQGLKMLVLSRKTGETVTIGEGVDLVILEINRGRVKLGFAGPRHVAIRRGELGGTHAVEASASEWNKPSEDPSPVAPLRAFRIARV